jgi:hypothetical protein
MTGDAIQIRVREIDRVQLAFPYQTNSVRCGKAGQIHCRCLKKKLVRRSLRVSGGRWPKRIYRARTAKSIDTSHIPEFSPLTANHHWRLTPHRSILPQ